jgi:hypothetical protein
MWGRLYGVGAVAVAHVQCIRSTSFWHSEQGAHLCQEFINLIDANTGEVLVAVDDNVWTESAQESPSWVDIVEKLAEAYPKYFKRKLASEKIEYYNLESQESAKRQREIKIEQESSPRM